MTEHMVETCPDDLDALKQRLDEIASGGAEIVTVLWQSNRVDNDQIAALEARGSFVIVARTRAEAILRTARQPEEGVSAAI